MTEGAVPSLLATLFERLAGQEALELEGKSARGGLPTDLWPTISAFANTQGGWIVLGVSERDGTLSVEGVPNASALLTVFWNQLRNPTKISYPISSASDVCVESLGDKQLIVLRVPAAPRKFRPVYINGNPYLGTYVRRHTGDYHCTKPEVDRMMREASDIAADSAILAHYGFNDLDDDALARYRRRYQTLHPASPWNGYDNDRFLAAVGGYRRDRETGAQGITVAGLLLLGKAEALREWRTRHLIDYRLVPSDGDSDIRWDDRIVWEGNLFGGFEVIYPRLTSNQPVPFRLEGSTRIDDSPVQVALREALVNLLVHADYAETQVSLVQRSPAGYLFRNPGSSRIPEGDLLTGDRSDPRNPELVRMFRLVGLAEEAGTGIPKIIRAWRELGFRVPDFDVGTERYEFALGLRHAHLLSEDDRLWLRSLGGGWTEAEQLALVFARHDGDVDNLKLRRLTGQHPADVTKVLGGLRSRDLLEMIGGGRSARYQLGPAASGPGAIPVPSLFEAERGAEGTQVTPSGVAPNSGNLVDSSGNLVDSSGNLVDSSGNLESDLSEVAQSVRGRRHLEASTLADILFELCSRRPLSLRELAALVGRSDERVRQALRPLVASGRIAFSYPEQPSHPQQKYTATPSSGEGKAT